MKTICGSDCCASCTQREACGGCEHTNGHPFGGACIAAECIKNNGENGFTQLKRTLIDEINALQIKDLRVDDLNLLNGFFVNVEYPLSNGGTVKFLNDNNIYLGNQIEKPNSDRCYGVVADEAFMIVCEYGCNGADPVLLRYQKR